MWPKFLTTQILKIGKCQLTGFATKKKNLYGKFDDTQTFWEFPTQQPSHK